MGLNSVGHPVFDVDGHHIAAESSQFELVAPKSSIGDAVVKQQREPRVGDVYKNTRSGEELVVSGFVRRDRVRFTKGTWLHTRQLGTAKYPLIKEFDCSDTDNVIPPDKGENKKEELHMGDFKKGDRVYRLGDGWSRAKHGEEGSVLAVNVSGSLKVQMDNGHCTPNGSSKKFALVTPRTGSTDSSNKGGTMPFAIKIENQTVINGDVLTKNTSDERLYDVIRAGEAEIKRLNEMANKPASLTAKVEALQAGIDAVVTLCDEKAAA